jgi:hypothetical protein
MAVIERERDMACQPGSSRGSARLPFFFNTYCMGANSFAGCLRRLCRGLFWRLRRAVTGWLFSLFKLRFGIRHMIS